MLFRKDKASANGQSDVSTSLIDLRGVIKDYETPAGSFRALKGVDLQIEAGEFVAIIGKSGSGKSTLINMITGIDRPSEGDVFVANTPVHKLSENQLADWRGKQMGIIFQFFQLLPTLTVIENVMLPMEFAGSYNMAQRRARAAELLDRVGIVEEKDKLPSALSGGQQQRVAIARALANDPAVIVADEPTGNLDSNTANAIFDLFEDLTVQGKTIVMVTHDNDLADRVHRSIIVHDGSIVDEVRQSAVAYPFPGDIYEPMISEMAGK